MKIIDYDNFLDKKVIADSAYKVCDSAAFPVDYQDVYEHLFGSDNLILKLLIDEQNNVSGFGVFENYKLTLKDNIVTMLYLSGMVIDKKYQGKNISQEIIKNAYKQVGTDLISLRTQNIAMAKSLINLFSDNLFVMPNNINQLVLKYLRQSQPFENINDYGIIENCYPNQLYYDLNAIKDNFNIELHENDALVVVIEPRKVKQKQLSIFKNN